MGFKIPLPPGEVFPLEPLSCTLIMRGGKR